MDPQPNAEQPIPEAIQEVLDDCNAQILEARRSIREAEQRRRKLHGLLAQMGFTVLHEIEGMMSTEQPDSRPVEDRDAPRVSDQ
jgi:hypothetical protein